MRRHRIRGNLLAMVMAFMFVLVTIVIAMHTTQARATRSVTQSEAELQFRQSSEFAIAKLVGVTDPNFVKLPGWLKVTAEPELVGDLMMPASYGTTLWTGLPNWNPKGQDFAPGHRTYELQPETSDQALKVFAKNFRWLSLHDSGGYAVYAPEGEVTLERGVGWANPNFEDDRKAVDAFSGVPFLVAAKSTVEIVEMPYGRVYSEDGPITLGSDSKDLAVAFQGPLPLRAYQDDLRKALQAAKTDLEGAAVSGDKTKDISGGALAGVGAVLDMLVSGKPDLNVSLEQAMQFPFPMIPGFSATVPGVFFEFWFHLPYPPDFSSTTAVSDDQAKKNGEAVEKLDKEIKALESEIAVLNGQISSTPPGPVRDGLIATRDGKVAEKNAKQAELDVIQEQIKDQSEAATNEVKSKTPNSPPGAPQTRQEDDSIPDTGQKGWNYSVLLSKMLNLLWSTISGDLKEIAKTVSADVRLVHFGDKENIPNFKFGDGFFAEASWTVPSGRNFRYQGNMTLEGDLWLQKGSLMVVTGDLVLKNPDPSSSAPLKPSGKIVIEEGASLIVSGSITAAGDPRYGSLWACTPPKHLAPVTSAIMAGKSVTLPYGSFSATNLQDAAVALGSAGLADALDTATVQMAPNLAKIAGPFHTRQPFFASYATTFQLTIVPTPFGPIIIPTPIPLTKTNILVPLFRTLTMLYTGSLNMGIGENLYLHSDWWPYGQGVVPAMIKLDPSGPMKAFKNVNLGVLNPSLDWGDSVNKLTENLLKGAAEFAITTVGNALIKEVMASVVPGGSLLSGLLDTLLEKINTKGSALDNFQTQMVQATFGPVLDQLKDMRRKIEDEVKAALAESYLREVGGPLIYADSIKVGDGSTRPLLMAGMLVAENDINVDSESFVGSLTSFKGNITAGKVYFTPVFTRASFYRPKSAGSTALARVAETGYGEKFDSGLAVDVGTGVWQVTTEGWSR